MKRTRQIKHEVLITREDLAKMLVESGVVGPIEMPLTNKLQWFINADEDVLYVHWTNAEENR